MDVAARITAKGQITIPKSVRDAVGVAEGDTLIFRVQPDGRVVLAPTVGLLDLAGVIDVPDDVRGLDWEQIRRLAWAARGRDAGE